MGVLNFPKEGDCLKIYFYGKPNREFLGSVAVRVRGIKKTSSCIYKLFVTSVTSNIPISVEKFDMGELVLHTDNLPDEKWLIPGLSSEVKFFTIANFITEW